MRNNIFTLLLAFVGVACLANIPAMAVPVTGNSGPGGLGKTDGTTNLKLWLKSETLSAGPVSAWTDSSGSGFNFSQATGTKQPTLTTGVLNGGTQSVVRFVAANQQQLTRTGFVNTPNQTIFTVSASSDVTRWNPIFLHQQNPGLSYGWNTGNNNRVYLVENDISLQALSTSTFVNNQFHLTTGTWAGAGANQPNNQQIFINGNPETTSSDPMALGAGLVAEIGSRQGSNQYLQGDIAEIITFNTNLGAAQRSIVENYLSAKYNLALTTGNRYTGDDAINGDYDRDVFGVGSLGGTDVQVNSGAAGFGIEVVSGASSNQLNSGEFILAGHKVATNSILTGQNIDGQIADRWLRTWYVDNNGSEADATLGFNFDEAGLTGLFDAGTTYKLIYSSDVSLASWDILPYTSSLQLGNTISFNLPAGMLANGYYTLAFNFPPVPEPSSIGLLAMGAMLVLRRKHANK